MISDNDLYSLAIFLGSLSMLLIIVYHFLEINAKPDPPIAALPLGVEGKLPPPPPRAAAGGAGGKIGKARG